MEKTEVKNEQQLETFLWDSEESGDFFGIENTSIKIKEEKPDKTEVKKEVKTEVKKEEVKEVKEKTETEEVKEEVEDVEFFTETTENVSIENEEEDKLFYTNLASGLKEKGVLTTVEFKDDEELSETDFINLTENEIDSRVDETFEGFFEELDSDAKLFLKFKKEGGSTSAFMEMIGETSTVPSGNIEEPGVQKRVLEYYYKNIEGVDEDDIADKLDWLEEGGRTEKYAKKYKGIIDRNDKDKKDKILKNQENINKDKEIEKDKFQKILKTTLSDIDTVNDFPITKKDKSELFTYITKPSVKVGKNKYITAFQKGLQDISNDNESLILLAKLIKSNFDIADLEKKVETKQTINLKNKLQKTKKYNKPNTSGGSGRKSLSDFF